MAAVEETPPEAAAEAVLTEAAASEPDVASPVEAEDPNADLPPIESLDKHSDYTAFLRPGVAPELRNQALAKLWRSDPVFANLDGLLEYGEDFSLPFKNPTAVATLYQVGKGMVEAVLDESPPTDAAAAEETDAKPIAPESTEPAQSDSAIAKSAPGETGETMKVGKGERG